MYFIPHVAGLSFTRLSGYMTLYKKSCNRYSIFRKRTLLLSLILILRTCLKMIEIKFQPFLKVSKSCFIFHKILYHLFLILQASYNVLTFVTPHTLLTFQTSCPFPKRTRSFKKRTRRFHGKNKGFLKFGLLFFSITASTCRTALFFLQIFQPLRKHPACRHSG